MTFQEFFHKKKIDLVLLKAGEPSLYEEFSSDYEQMGSKSFDHSKKFWFNKLRRLYHLKEEPKPVVEQTEQVSSEIASPSISKQVDEADSPGVEQPVVAPVFKPAFKPRFKPGLTKPQESPPDQEKQ